MDGLRLAPLSLVAGIGLGVATVAVYQSWWWLALAIAASLLVEVAAPRGWGTRLPLALGLDGVVALTAVPRSEGDYLIASTSAGYTVLGLALVALCFAVATLPRPGRQNPEPPAESAPLE